MGPSVLAEPGRAESSSDVNRHALAIGIVLRRYALYQERFLFRDLDLQSVDTGAPSLGGFAKGRFLSLWVQRVVYTLPNIRISRVVADGVIVG